MDKINKIKKVLVVLCILLIFVLIGFILVINFTRKAETDNSTGTNKENYVEHTSYDFELTINTPKSWQAVEVKNSLNENAILELHNEEKNAYLVIVVNKKEDINDDFTKYKTDVFTQKETYYKTTITAYYDVVIDGYNAQYGELYYTNADNINTYIRAYAFETNTYYGQLVIWTLKSNENEVQEEFNKISESLVEKKDVE